MASGAKLPIPSKATLLSAAKLKRKRNEKEEEPKETIYCIDPVINQQVKDLIANELDNPNFTFEHFPKWENYRLFPCGHCFGAELTNQGRIYSCPHCRGAAGGFVTVDTMHKHEAWAIIRRTFPEEECKFCFVKATPFFLKHEHVKTHTKCLLCPAICGDKHRCPKRMMKLYCQAEKIAESEIGNHVAQCFYCLREIVHDRFYDNIPL